MTVFRHWPRLSVLRSGLPPEPPPATIGEQFLRAARKARGQEPPDLPPDA